MKYKVETIQKVQVTMEVEASSEDEASRLINDGYGEITSNQDLTTRVFGVEEITSIEKIQGNDLWRFLLL